MELLKRKLQRINVGDSGHYYYTCGEIHDRCNKNWDPFVNLWSYTDRKQLEVSVNLTNQKVQFTGASRSNPSITFDYDPPLGDGQGYTGLELLLMSLAAYSGTSIVALLRSMNKSISGFKINGKGIRRDEHPTSFQTIFLEYILNSKDLEDEHIQKAIQLSEETYCPVWAMVKNSVEIVTEYKIIAS